MRPTLHSHPARFFKATTGSAGAVGYRRAVLSTPFPDLAGDIVRPEGIDWTPHAADPAVDLEHGRDARIGMAPVGWMRESLDRPGAPYSGSVVELDFGTPGAPEIHKALVGTIYFDLRDRVGAQVFALVEQGALGGTSIEFRPPPRQFMKALGPSPLENRSAYDFLRCEMCGLAVCARGVNPAALMATVNKSLPQVPDLLAKIVADKRVNVGGTYEPLAPVLQKALAGIVARPRPTRAVVRVETKAMWDDDQQTDDGTLTTANEDAVMGDAADGDMDGDAPASGGVAAKYKFAQAIMDAVAEYESDLQTSDSPELRKQGAAFALKAKQLAGEIQSAGHAHDAILNGGGEMAADDELADQDGGDAADDLDAPNDDEGATADATDETATDADGDAGDAEDEGAPKGKKKPPFLKKAAVLDADGFVKTRRRVYKSLLYKRFSDGELEHAERVAKARRAADAKRQKQEAARLAEIESRLDRLCDKFQSI